jgi:phage terminase large subunit GpA-like protein
MVRKFCLNQLRQGIELYPCKGKGNAGLNEPELVSFNAQKQQKGIKAPTWTIGTNRAKRAIFNHILLDPPGANTMNFTDKEGAGYDSNYFDMLTAEKEITKYSMGQEYRAFIKKKSGGRNEALDIRAYGYACAVSLNPDWDGLRELISRKQPKEKTIEANGSEPEEQKPMNPTMKPRPKKRSKRGGGGFVGRY